LSSRRQEKNNARKAPKKSLVDHVPGRTAKRPGVRGWRTRTFSGERTKRKSPLDRNPSPEGDRPGGPQHQRPPTSKVRNVTNKSPMEIMGYKPANLVTGRDPSWVSGPYFITAPRDRGLGLWTLGVFLFCSGVAKRNSRVHGRAATRGRELHPVGQGHGNHVSRKTNPGLQTGPYFHLCTNGSKKLKKRVFAFSPGLPFRDGHRNAQANPNTGGPPSSRLRESAAIRLHSWGVQKKTDPGKPVAEPSRSCGGGPMSTIPREIKLVNIWVGVRRVSFKKG